MDVRRHRRFRWYLGAGAFEKSIGSIRNVDLTPAKMG